MVKSVLNRLANESLRLVDAIPCPCEPAGAFTVTTMPAPAQLGRSLEEKVRLRRATMQLRFGQEVAALAIRDVWSACCELLLAS